LTKHVVQYVKNDRKKEQQQHTHTFRERERESAKLKIGSKWVSVGRSGVNQSSDRLQCIKCQIIFFVSFIYCTIQLKSLNCGHESVL